MSTPLQRAASRKMVNFKDKAKLDPKQVLDTRKGTLAGMLLPGGNNKSQSNALAPYRTTKKFSRKGLQA